MGGSGAFNTGQAYSLEGANMTPSDNSIPFGFCHCGCGRKTSICTHTDKRKGHILGQPIRFICGHSNVQIRNDSKIVVVEGVSCRTMPLSRGQEAILDVLDYEQHSEYHWIAQWSECTKTFYAKRRDGKLIVSLHRLIMGISDPKVLVDHVNGNTLDNRRSNLRIATRSQNNANRKISKDNTSGFKGVTWNKRLAKWVAQITSGGKVYHLGVFEYPEAAHAAYCKAAREKHGEFANTGMYPPSKFACWCGDSNCTEHP